MKAGKSEEFCLCIEDVYDSKLLKYLVKKEKKVEMNIL